MNLEAKPLKISSEDIYYLMTMMSWRQNIPRGSPFHSGTEKERNKREWLRQVSLLAAGFIPQVL